MFKRTTQPQSGFTYVELIIVTAIVVLVFGALAVSFQYTLKLGYTTRVKLSALSLANDRMEFFRSLPYDDVGLIASSPVGAIPRTSTFVLNGFTIEEEIWVDYYDDPADGGISSSTADTNGINEDYKTLKALYTWDFEGNPGQLSLSAFIVPRSIETATGNGTIRINVIDANSALLEGATVEVIGSSTTAPYYGTRPSTGDGTALFSVPADSGYQIFVSGVIGGHQYSTSSTYVATTSNPNPVLAPIAVGMGGISTLTFQIDRLSDLTVHSYDSITEDNQTDEFASTAGIATSTGVVVSGGQLQLDNPGSGYVTTGIAYLPVVPSTIDSWRTLRLVADTPTDTALSIAFYTGVPGAYTLIPDADLPGNSTGFVDTLIDLQSLDATTYPDITAAVTLSTTNTAVTPTIDELTVYWRESVVPRTSDSLTLTGSKTIGVLSTSTPIFKTVETVVTNGSGEVTATDLEFDQYQVTSDVGLSLATVCPAYPVALAPGVDQSVDVVFAPAASLSLRLQVRDALGRSIPGASVQTSQASTSYDVTQSTNTCGQTYFDGMVGDGDYQIDISAPGYSSQTIDPFSIIGQTETVITLTP